MDNGKWTILFYSFQMTGSDQTFITNSLCCSCFLNKIWLALRIRSTFLLVSCSYTFSSSELLSCFPSCMKMSPGILDPEVFSSAVEFPTQYANHRPESEAHTAGQSGIFHCFSNDITATSKQLEDVRFLSPEEKLTLEVLHTGVKENHFLFHFQDFSILQWSSNRRIKKHNQCHNFTEPEGYFLLV